MVRIDDEARDAWKAFADRHGVTVAALLEVIGLGLPDGELGPVLVAVVEQARAIDVERRRRG